MKEVQLRTFLFEKLVIQMFAAVNDMRNVLHIIDILPTISAMCDIQINDKFWGSTVSVKHVPFHHNPSPQI